MSNRRIGLTRQHRHWRPLLRRWCSASGALCHHGIVSTGEIPQVLVTELPDDFTDDPQRVLLDVREDDEWAAGHVRGAQHIPLGDIPTRLDEIDLDADLYVVCHSSGRSMRVLAYLERQGYEGTCVAGGMLAWHQHGKPMVAGPGTEPEGMV